MTKTPFIENEFTHLSWTPDGELSEMKNRKSGRNWLRPHRLCRLILEKPGLLEFETFPSGECRIESDGKQVCFSFDQVEDENGTQYRIRTEVTAILEDENVRWKIEVENRTEETVVRETHCPLLSIEDKKGSPALISSENISSRYEDLRKTLLRSFTAYMAPDHKYIRKIGTYPGMSLSMNFSVLDYGTEGLYLGCHDPEFFMTTHGFELEKREKINCFIARFPFVRSGEKKADQTVVTSVYSGNWFRAARKYRKWADCWYTPVQMPEHVRNSPGWQRVIMHHQYGEYFFHYKDLPRILEHGLYAGIDTIFLFGWTREGMDAGYPQYSADPEAGGMDELRKNILEVRKNGGHVILYFNGQLIDTSSDFYRNGNGQKISVKRPDGTEHREFYNFSNTGTLIRQFGNKTFTLACPSSAEWLEILKDHVDFAWEAGADGVFFDQLGYTRCMCADPSHGHPVPFVGIMNSRRESLKKIYEYVKSKSPEFALGVEYPVDLEAPFCDFVHIWGNTAQVRNPGFRENGERPELLNQSHLFRAAFPEVYLSDRDIRDDRDVVFPVNMLTFWGVRSDVEIFRCRADLSAAPVYGEYLKKANRLRMRYRELLLNGTFVAQELHSVGNPLVLSNGFIAGEHLAIILTQSSAESLETNVSVPGFELLEFDSIRGDVVRNGENYLLPRDALTILIYKKL